MVRMLGILSKHYRLSKVIKIESEVKTIKTKAKIKLLNTIEVVDSYADDGVFEYILVKNTRAVRAILIKIGVPEYLLPNYTEDGKIDLSYLAFEYGEAEYYGDQKGFSKDSWLKRFFRTISVL